MGPSIALSLLPPLKRSPPFIFLRLDPSPPQVHDMVKLQADTSTAGTQWGTGGMATKLTAGRIAVAAGCCMVICNAKSPELIEDVMRGEERIGTK